MYSMDCLVDVIHMLMFPVCAFIQTCSSTHDMQNIVYIYIYTICCVFVGVDNKLYKIHGIYIKIDRLYFLLRNYNIQKYIP
jgi:hypothetical protein